MTDEQMEVYKEGVLFGFQAAVEYLRETKAQILFTYGIMCRLQDDFDAILEAGHSKQKKENEDHSKQDRIQRTESSKNLGKPAYLRNY